MIIEGKYEDVVKVITNIELRKKLDRINDASNDEFILKIIENNSNFSIQ